jgi:oxaloacetate decarboxylase gamma subunit
MKEDIISQGLELMLFGMGTVIVFLTLLVIATSVMSALLSRYAPAPEVADAGAAVAPASPDTTLLAVISAAIHKHRSRR